MVIKNVSEIISCRDSQVVDTSDPMLSKCVMEMVLMRRFSQFSHLYQSLTQQVKNAKIPEIPKKQLFPTVK